MPRIVHFEVMAEDPTRAVKFYQNVFGWHVNKWEGDEEAYWLVTTGTEGEGINGGIAQRRCYNTIYRKIQKGGYRHS